MPIPDFSPVTKAIADLEASEKALETASGQNDSAQSNLATVTANSNNAIAAAQQTATDATAQLATAQQDTVAKSQALDQAIQAYEAQLNPPAAPPAS